MSAVGHNPLSPSLTDSIGQASTELERNPTVSCLHHPVSAFVDDLQTQDSGSGFFTNAQNILITGGTVVSRSRRLRKYGIIIHVVLLDQ
jgi:hypothetical protein